MSSVQRHIVGFCGSLRKQSLNRALLQQAAGFLPGDYRFTEADLSVIPLYNQDLEAELPQPVRELAELVRSADAILISSPEYNHSIAGVLKNALDWLSRPAAGTPLVHKPVGIMGATPGRLGTVRAQIHLRDVLFSLNMAPINRPEVLVGEAAGKFDANGNLADEATAQVLKQLVDNLRDVVEAKA